MEDVTRLSPSCPRCGSPLPPDAPEGLCAACLLAAGAHSVTQSSTDDMPTVSSGGASSVPRPTDGQRLAMGAAWGPYRIGRLLGRGGMGEVYEAEHTETGRRMALKVLRSRLQGAQDRARFLREGQLAASISHPHTVYIFGSEEISGMPAIAMELLPGGTLKDRVAGHGPLPPREAAAAVLDIIGGLDAAQAAGILHRDIKPSNCFLDSEGSVKVGDFGLSISTLARDVRHEIGTEGFQGTPQFAAPEQLRGEPLDVRADIYAVGATLYYLLTGRPPFDDRDLRTLLARAATEQPPSPRSIQRDVPPGLAAVVLQCLAKPPAQRPGSYAELAERLRPFATTDAAPAPMGARLVAGVIDFVLLTLPPTIWTMSTVDPLTNPGPDAATGAVKVSATLASLAYYTCLEGIWGASLGKRLLGLRVAAETAGRPRWLQIAWRTVLFHLPGLLFALAAALVGPHPALTTAVAGVPVVSGAAVLLLAAMFLTARRHNGWAAVHDLASGTRVVAQAAGTAPRTLALDSAPAAAGNGAAPDGLRFGPFTAVSGAGSCGEGRLFVAFDPVLRRRVWVLALPPGTPQVAPARRDVGRVGRLYWLMGKRTAVENWDAFEAPDGEPFATRRDPAPGWATLKLWLLDLADELTASARDGSMPALGLERLWLRQDGRLVLLDFPAPGTQPTPSAAPDLTPIGLLSAVARGWLSAVAATGRTPPAMPLSARALIESWSGPAPPVLDAARTSLLQAAASPDAASRKRRAIPIALASTPILVLMLLSLLLAPFLARFAGSQDIEVLRWLEMLRQEPRAGSRLADPQVRDALEKYVVGRHGATLRDERFWRMGVMQGQLGALRGVADGILGRHPAVSKDEMAALQATIAPEMERISRSRERDQGGLAGAVAIIITALTAVAAALLLAASVVSSLVVPGGLVTRLLGLAVITRDGREIGRWRSLARTAAAWLPAAVWLVYLATGPKIQGWVPAPPMPLAGTGLALGLMAAGALWTIARPARGPHDWLAGTWVTPR